jgi:hypothetical protein
MPSPGRRGHLSNRDGSAPLRDRGTGTSAGAIAGTLRRLDRALPRRRLPAIRQACQDAATG